MTDTALSLDARAAARLQGAFGKEELLGLRLAAKLRFATLAAVSAWLLFQVPWPGVLFYLVFMPAFAAIGVLPLVLRRLGVDEPWARYLMPLLDVALLSFMLFVANPLEPDWLPAPMKLKLGNQVYYYVLVASTMLFYSPRVVLWTGLLAALAWTLGALWVLDQPGSYLGFGTATTDAMALAERIAFVADPRRVDPGWVGSHVVAVLIVSGILAAIVWRTRRLVLKQAMAERERGNLARYFSSNLVDDLARSDEPLGAVRTQAVAVLFVDIAGFTALSADQPPAEVIALLRDFHGRMEAQVFAHGGTLDKYLGDGLMATFGTPWPGDGDAGRALGCARAMVAAMAAWNRERRSAGRPQIRVGVGIHYGPAVLGDIGGANRLEFAVIGDTVNVASRLEHLTRALDVAVVASDDVVAAARREAAPGAPDLSGFAEAPPQAIRGRDGRLKVWTLARAEGAAGSRGSIGSGKTA